MKIRHLVLISLTFSASICAFAAEAITVDESRPLDKLALKLVQRYGYLVTYEEAPYDESGLRTDVRLNGVRFRYPSWVPTVFHVPDRPIGPTAGSPEPAHALPPLGPSVLDPLLKEYHDAGNPGRFKVIFEGEYAHIVPAARVVNGKAEDFQPVLSARIAFPSETRSCNETLRDLFSRIKTVRDVTVVGGAIPIGSLIRQQCRVTGEDLTAREILLQILDQVGMIAIPKLRFAWGLLYDANGDKYFLSTTPVPNMASPDVATPPRPVEKVVVPLGTAPRGTRLGVPVKKQ